MPFWIDNMLLYLDTETTGLHPGQICQLAYIMQDRNGARAKNFFFTVGEMTFGALAVHGFSIEKLKELSNEKTFGDYVDEIEQDFLSADVVVCHNVNFDFMFLREEFSRLGRDFVCKNEFCTMKSLTPVCKIFRSNHKGYKYPKLSEACEFFGISDIEIKKDVERFFGVGLDYHDARFDTVALYLVANFGLDKGLERLKEFL